MSFKKHVGFGIKVGIYDQSFHILKLHHLYFRTIYLWLGQRSIKKKNDTQFTFSRDCLIFEKLPTKV